MRNDFCSNYLEHSAKGKTWSNHRYVAKVKLPSGKWFYFYDANAYQNYLKKQGGGNNGQFAKANPYKEMVEAAAKNDPNLQNLTNNETKGKTLAEKTKTMQTNIENGEKKIQELLGNTKDSKSKKKSGSGSSKKKEATIKAKPVRSSKSSKKKSEKNSSKSGSSKKTSEKTSNNKEKQAVKDSRNENAKGITNAEQLKNENAATQTTKPFTVDSLKKTFGIEDSDVNKHENTSALLEKIKSYDDGSNGYIIAGDKIYKWSKNDGDITFMDYETDKEVTLGSELKDIQEFVINGKKKK